MVKAMLKKLVIVLCFYVVSLTPGTSQTFGESPSNELYPIVAEGKFGYINSIGKIVISTQFDNAGYFEDGLAPIAVGKK